ncbi:carboxymuconolactone decarboxylase family protein [Neobacillus pocheonensis]|uniref:Carboxymuconolactone decarboxylase family protein n=1 Tax=Neobacillus pocheonensis TaxID=363869 RepID=A0ABT0WG82_9BACI|nr:carboxymuconolactone decarboxylase family protein [Neobacillus pocheonensis]
MDRVEKSKEKYKQLFGNGVPAAYATDPDFQDILSRFIFGEVFYQGNLDDKQRELITLVVLTTNQTLPQLKAHVGAALNVGLTPVEIKEAIYQCSPYIGFPKTLNAINEVNEVFKSKNIPLPIESQKTVDEDNRFEKGLATQVEIFGDAIAKMQESAPSNQKHMQEYLSAFCFGDFYTRGGLDLKTRELLTLCIVSSLGGAEGQVKAHVQGNKNVGNDKETLITAITHCLPYMGFPRTLNALSCVNEVIPENE